MQSGKARHEKAMAYIAVRNIFHNFALNERRLSATKPLDGNAAGLFTKHNITQTKQTKT